MFREFFDINIGSAAEDDLRLVHGWINQCYQELRVRSGNSIDWHYLLSAMHTLDLKINDLEMRRVTTAYIEAISSIPNCDNDSVIDLFKSTISGSPQAQSEGIKLLAVKDFKDITRDTLQPAIALALNSGTSPASFVGLNEPSKLKRFCEFDALLNSGERELSFSLKWFDQPGGQLVLQISN